MKETKMRSRGMRGIVKYASGGAAMAAVLLMVLAPMSAGATVIIPVKKFGASVGYGVSTGACAKAKILAAPKWAPATGLFHAAGMSSSPHCAPSPSSNSAFVNLDVNLNQAIHFKANGNYTITTAWSIAMKAVWNATGWGVCTLNYKVAFSACISGASAQVFGYSYLYDQNNGSYFNFGSYVQTSNYTTVENYSQNYCYAGSCHHYGGNLSFGMGSGSFSGTIAQNSTIAASGTNWVRSSDTYTLDVTLYIFLDTQAYVQNAKATGMGSALASMDMASLGNGAHLVSVSYS